MLKDDGNGEYVRKVNVAKILQNHQMSKVTRFKKTLRFKRNFKPYSSNPQNGFMYFKIVIFYVGHTRFRQWGYNK